MLGNFTVCLFTLLIACCNWALAAADEKSLLIAPFSSSLLSPIENERVRSAIIRISAKQQTYHLVFKSSAGAALASPENPLLLLKVEYADLGDGQLEMSASIVRTEDDKFVKRVTREGFGKEHLRKMTELVLEVLFGLAAPEVLNFLEEPEPEEPKERVERTRERRERDRGATVAFKRRIISFKQEISQEFERKEQEREEKASAEAENENRKKESSSTVAAMEGAPMPSEEEVASPRLRSGVDWIKSFSVLGGFDYQSFSVTDKKGSVAEVEIGTDFIYLMAGGEGVIYHPDFPWLKTYAQVIALSPMVDDEQVGGSSALSVSLGARAEIGEDKGEVAIYLQRESLNIAVLPKMGEGLELAQFALNWVGVRAQYKVNPNLSLALKYKTLISATSSGDHGDATGFSASSYGAGAVYDTGFLLAKSKVYFDINFLSFSNTATLPMEGSGRSARLYLGWTF